ncbi:superoxide dismutase family protein [Ramlibacter sp.]|uniref:superoxide dismutase family protein n=1 Tax=Ramlibacter sp. TaxID=1917967 RepID=UPI00180FF59A|nr:superoxide dismutase family protein [Ramlibacter sp.]MBA2673034.1 superoxide dismutase family protein [Ramlibacter sp.]
MRASSAPILSTGLLAAALLAGCAGMLSGDPAAVATLQPTTGSTVSGTVRFVQSGGQVAVTGEVRGLKPNAEHGFHVHEKGDCSSGDGMSAGGHFNPGGQPHGQHAQGAHHAGDLLSLKADAAGTAKISFTTPAVTVGQDATDVVGRGLIVHRDADDYTTQPTGNAGPRLACAVITRA